jgi:hypothetical protein
MSALTAGCYWQSEQLDALLSVAARAVALCLSLKNSMKSHLLQAWPAVSTRCGFAREH